jgi:hypothetical protein
MNIDLTNVTEFPHEIEMPEEDPSIQSPYIFKYVINIERRYNPDYGDDRICKCGHSYYRHFDSYENNDPVGCKYCSCFTFVEKKIKRK